MPERLTVILKQPIANVRVRDLSDPARAGAQTSAIGEASRHLSAVANVEHVRAALEAQLQAQHQQQSQQFQQMAAQLRQQVDSEMAALNSARAALQQAGAGLSKMRQQILVDSEQQLLDLAVEIARKVLMQDIQAQRYEIAPIVEAALAQLPSRDGVTVRLNPADHHRCIASVPADEGHVRFVPDPSVPSAGCIVESGEGIVESDIQSHLAAIAQNLKVES